MRAATALACGLAAFLAGFPARAEDIAELEKVVCQHESTYMCEKAAQAQPKVNIVGALTTLRPVIHAAARRYGVDPRAIVGSILAEHSMNVTVEDSIQDLVVKSGASPDGSLFGRKFTFGLGQLNLERAESVEALAAGTEGRPIRSSREINEILLTPEGAIHYVAALIKEAQDAYGQAGYDISRNIPVLATLYNIGKIRERLERTKVEKRLPIPNYFGLFVAKHFSMVDQITKAEARSRALTFDRAEEKVYARGGKVLPITMYSLKEDLRLDNGPRECGNTAPFLRGALRAKAGARLRILNRTVDCDLSLWVLVQDEAGNTGWTSAEALSRASIPVRVDPLTCVKKPSPVCRKAVMDGVPRWVRGSRGEDPILLRLSGTDIEPYDPDRPLQFEAELGKETELIQKAMKADQEAIKRIKPLRIEDMKEIQAAVMDFKFRVAKALKLDPWGGPSIRNSANPYGSYGHHLFLLDPRCHGADLAFVKSFCRYECKAMGDGPGARANDDTCYGDKEGILRHLREHQIHEKPTYQELKSFFGTRPLKYFRRASLAKLAPTFEPEPLAREIARRLNRCWETTFTLPASARQVREMQDQFMEELSDARKGGSPSADIKDLLEDWDRSTQPLRMVCDDLDPVILDPATGDALPEEECRVRVPKKWNEKVEPYRRGWEVVATTLRAFRKMFKSREEEDLYVAAYLKHQTPSRFYEEEQSKSERMLSVRDLTQAAVKALQSASCKDARVYVPQPWLATSPEIIYRPSHILDGISVETGSTSCSP